MIKIHTNKDNTVQINISKGTPHQEFLLGLEMLVEITCEETGLSIDDVLSAVKRIYISDKEEK